MPPEPPQNAEYLVAAYVITTIILAAYWVALWRRARRVLKGNLVRPPPPGWRLRQ